MSNEVSKPVSLIIPSSRRPLHLADLLDSIDNIGVLDREDYEIIVVDSNPLDDETRCVCKEYNVVYLRERVPGKSRAVNRGIQNASGEYIALTDDDVVVKDPNWLDKMLNHFSCNEKLGYVAGNVLALSVDLEAQAIWERKGGLSKGARLRHYNQDYFHGFHVSPWPINKIAVGANCMIPRRVFDENGGLCTQMGPGAPIPHGESLEIVYRIIRADYELLYDPSIQVFHKHPQTPKDLRRKLYIYGIGNSAYQIYIFFQYADIRSLYWGVIGHNLYVLRNLIRGLRGRYSLPLSYTMCSLLGSIVGIPVFFSASLKHCLQAKAEDAESEERN